MLVAHAGADPASADPEFTNEELLDAVLNEIEMLAGQSVSRLSAESVEGPDKAIMLLSSLTASFEVPPLSTELIATLSANPYWDTPHADRPQPEWPAARAPDYLHLRVYAPPPEVFNVSGTLLAFLADRNDFQLAGAGDIVVFGLRGCRIAGSETSRDWAEEHTLVVDPPTHLAQKCVLGLWRRSDSRVAVFRGSTVPAAHNMFASLFVQGNGTSLLPTGLYTYHTGTHKASPATSAQRGALLIAGTYPVLRTAASLVYDPFLPTTAWTLGAGHNIHAAGHGDIFNSAGCQVVHGNYVKPARTRTTGAWDIFRQLAGTAGPDGTASPLDAQKRFRYMLLTGLEAALADQGSPTFTSAYRPLRIGSRGPRVATLQESLLRGPASGIVTRADGDFGPRTAFGVLAASKADYGDYATPVSVGPASE
ncbi:MAG TPA: hypothetical protein DCY26_15965 [Hyphomonas sp.]|nr:hypothetical protein [Hyphomonas sp.]